MFVLILAYVVQMFIPCFVISTSSSVPTKCRTERRMYLPYEEYKIDVCARCYLYMSESIFQHKFQYDARSSNLRDPRTNTTYDADPFNISQALLGTFLEEHVSKVHSWRECCKAAWQCCDRMSKDPETTVGIHCPRTWDGWQCWDDTPAGTTARQPCPAHAYWASIPSCTKYASKECLPNGTWFFRPFTFKEWTNYRGCGLADNHRNKHYFHMAMHVVTVIGLIPALIIFMMYKQLHVHRISMHKNLFLSLLLLSACVVLFKCLVITPEINKASQDRPTLMQANGPLCKVLLILTKYFRMTNYTWMFCEGYYLHKLIAAAFAEQKTLRLFYAIGWAFPVVPVSVYAVLRATLKDENCWAFEADPYEWIMNAPNLMFLCVNMFFLCNIIRVLVTKLRATHANEPSQYRKAVRATLVMMPLFGLHFCFTLYRPETGTCLLFEAYNYFNNALDGLQGFMVAVLFCYLNGEVLYLIKRSYQRFKLQLQVIRRSHHLIHQSETRRKWSATQESSLNDSQNHHHHFHRIRHVENKLKEINNQTNGKENKGQNADLDV